ncbi:hypothetical protein EJ06DRAFT_529388 [Trichodelitschia bisporula]|uniref:Uncharacterized protein n=1 Tax=Trichodelitschia bisporula TaxID=703511 RepID=A0A6G1HYY5_9PEZI|nr:hypothetical protein EJ06DRAFT_529388 [Trichodelitschia bisporula]
MVEDEFRATAELFTRHLHHAEYKRLKHAATTRHATRIHTLTNPPTAPLLRRESWLALEAKARESVGGEEDGEEDNPDDPWLKSPNLARLMSQNSRPECRVVAPPAPAANTRQTKGMPNSAGLRKERPKKKEESDNDTDDLDACVQPRSRPAAEMPPPRKAESARNRGPERVVRPPARRPSVAGSSRCDSSPRSEVANIAVPDFPETPARALAAARVREQIAKRKAATAKKEAEHLNLADIPTFLY